MTDAEIINAIIGYAGYGNNETADYLAKAVIAYNLAKRRICKERFLFLRVPGVINITENKIDYNLASDLVALDQIYINRTPNRVQSATTWTLDTEANLTGHVDSALGDDVGVGSVFQVDDNLYQIEAYSGDGTANDSIELNYAAPSGDLVFVSDSDYSSKDPMALKPTSHHAIYYYPATSTRDIPRKYHIESYNVSGSDYSHKIFFGDPTADDTYLAEYWYFTALSDLTSDALTGTSLIVRMHNEDPLVFWGLYYFFMQIKAPERAANALPDAQAALNTMKKDLPYRKKNSSWGA